MGPKQGSVFLKMNRSDAGDHRRGDTRAFTEGCTHVKSSGTEQSSRTAISWIPSLFQGRRLRYCHPDRKVLATAHTPPRPLPPEEHDFSSTTRSRGLGAVSAQAAQPGPRAGSSPDCHQRLLGGRGAAHLRFPPASPCKDLT